MKVGFSGFQPIMTKLINKEKKEETSLKDNGKQVLKETIQRQLAKMEDAFTNRGDDDPKAQELIQKFKSGKKLTPHEMSYIRKKARGMIHEIDRIQKEREAIELSMKIAPTKIDVQMVALHATKQIKKYSNPEEREIRAKHLADAKHEYEKTDEYREKPNTFLDKEDQRLLHNKLKHNVKEQQHVKLAIRSYEKNSTHKSID